METKKKHPANYKLLIAGIFILLLMGGGIAGIYIGKAHKVNTETEQRGNDLKEGPLVKTALAVSGSGVNQITLIGEARPYYSSTLYAKISGYLDRINVDKGDKVTEGEEIAYVDNPEINQQYNAAVADLENKKKIAERDKKLLEKKFVSQEEADLSQTNVDMAQANVKSLADQQQYQYLRAPFKGTITARFVDPGALIQNADNVQTGAQPVVTLSELDKLRIYVYAEQSSAAFLNVGDSVTITLTERPKLLLRATITRMADRLDEHTRMMLCEIDISNKNDAILPGSYVQVHITVPSPGAPAISVPSVALIVQNGKTLVATVSKDSILHFKEITIIRNTGTMVVLTGLSAGERIALSVGESIQDGQKVRPTE